MLCIKLKAFDRACAGTTGGISRIWIFDRDDLNFTQAAADAKGNLPPYTAIALRSPADLTDGGLFPVIFQYKEAEYKYTQSLNGASSNYAHEVDFLLPDIGHFITNWNEKVDQASTCCGIGLIIQLNSGKIIVLGEKYVNGSLIREWRMAQDGSTGGTGKLGTDSNGQQTALKGDFFRSAYEYTGTIDALEALQNTDES